MKVNFSKGDGLVPAIIQDAQSMQVLMLGYMNEEALRHTQESGHVTFYSRSKQRLWVKGETSGNYLELVGIQLDCDGDTLLVRANPRGPTCHTGTSTCFGEEIAKGFLYTLESTIHARIDGNDPTSYTNALYRSGLNKVAQKVGEEAVELVIEAMDQDEQRFQNEAADLLYHFLVLLKAKNVRLEEIESVLRGRA